MLLASPSSSLWPLEAFATATMPFETNCAGGGGRASWVAPQGPSRGGGSSRQGLHATSSNSMPWRWSRSTAAVQERREGGRGGEKEAGERRRAEAAKQAKAAPPPPTSAAAAKGRRISVGQPTDDDGGQRRRRRGRPLQKANHGLARSLVRSLPRFSQVK